MKLPLRTRRWDDHIATLDAERDAREIVTLLANHVFPFEVLVAVELAQLRTFTIPTISRLLHATRQYEDEGQKRLDDTRAILTEIHEAPDGSDARREMVQHLNRIHAQYRISNDDYLYTLSTFIVDPWRFIERHGHRALTEHEKRAFYWFYRGLGEAMGMRDIPPSFDAFLAFRERYEAQAQRYSVENERVARGMIRSVASLLPAPLRPLTEPVLAALIDEPAFLSALGLAPPPAATRAAVHAALRLKRELDRVLNPFESQRLWDHPAFKAYPSYPGGYERLRLGPRKVLERLDRQAAGAAKSA